MGCCVISGLLMNDRRESRWSSSFISDDVGTLGEIRTFRWTVWLQVARRRPASFWIRRQWVFDDFSPLRRGRRGPGWRKISKQAAISENFRVNPDMSTEYLPGLKGREAAGAKQIECPNEKSLRTEEENWGGGGGTTEDQSDRRAGEQESHDTDCGPQQYKLHFAGRNSFQCITMLKTKTTTRGPPGSWAELTWQHSVSFYSVSFLCVSPGF